MRARTTNLSLGGKKRWDTCPDMASARREYLKDQLHLLTENPDAYVQTEGGLRFRIPQWL